ncbi:hypothetical protein, partial [Cupriavidus sp. WS]|uniref:hypothetical protein n=1 Tax=Cupriavidus sp. WS TaxID=1312922 RepID=UPI001E38ECC7
APAGPAARRVPRLMARRMTPSAGWIFKFPEYRIRDGTALRQGRGSILGGMEARTLLPISTKSDPP